MDMSCSLKSEKKNFSLNWRYFEFRLTVFFAFITCYTSWIDNVYFIFVKYRLPNANQMDLQYTLQLFVISIVWANAYRMKILCTFLFNFFGTFLYNFFDTFLYNFCTISFLIHLHKLINVVAVKTSVDPNINPFILNRKHALGTALMFVIEIPIKGRNLSAPKMNKSIENILNNFSYSLNIDFSE